MRNIKSEPGLASHAATQAPIETVIKTVKVATVATGTDSRMHLFFGLGLLFAALVLASIPSSIAHVRQTRAPVPLAGTPVDNNGSEFSFARLMYNNNGFGRGFGGGRCGSGSWTTDCPDAEHFFMEGLTRLTRVDGTKVNVNTGAGGVKINLRDGSVYDYPWLYAVEVGRWTLDSDEIRILREYLLRGGFLMVDDFHGTAEWGGFVASMQRVFPDRPIVDIEGGDEVFHVLYDLDTLIQIPGLSSLYSGQTYERDGYDPHWRGIYDEDGRLLVAINHNMDLGDAWEHADTPGYPEPMTALAYRFAVNYVIYSMTH